MRLFPTEPLLFQTNEKNTEKEKKYRNLSCEITTTVVTLAENNVFMKDLMAYSEKVIEKMIFRAFKEIWRSRLQIYSIQSLWKYYD